MRKGVRDLFRSVNASATQRISDQPALPLEPHLNTVLPVFGIIEGSEEWRRIVRLDVGRQERIERIIDADPHPRTQLADLEAVIDARVETKVCRETLGIAGRRFAEQFTWDNSADKTISHLKEVVQRGDQKWR